VESNLVLKVKYFTNIDPIRKIEKGDWIDLRSLTSIAPTGHSSKHIPQLIQSFVIIGILKSPQLFIYSKNGTKHFGNPSFSSLGFSKCDFIFFSSITGYDFFFFKCD